MRRPALAQDLVSVKEFRANMAKWLDHLGETGRPVVVTQRGRAAAVVVEPSALDEIEEGRTVIRKVLQGLRDAADGRVHEDEDVWAEVDSLLASRTPG
jgi:antitoxin YefM